MDFKIYSMPNDAVTKTLAKASATVIEDGDFVALSAGLAIKAVAASTAIGFAVAGAGDGETEITVFTDPKIVFTGTADANFAAANRGTEVDLVGTTTQLIDLGASATDVLKVEPGSNAGTIGSDEGVLVTINKPL